MIDFFFWNGIEYKRRVRLHECCKRSKQPPTHIPSAGMHNFSCKMYGLFCSSLSVAIHRIFFVSSVRGEANWLSDWITSSAILLPFYYCSVLT